MSRILKSGNLYYFKDKLMKNHTDANHVTKQTLVWAVVVSLTLGFLAGSVFTSFKLTSKNETSVTNNLSAESQSPADKEEMAKIASQIFQLEQVLKQNPEDANSWKTLGNLFFDSDQYENAIEAYTKYLSFDPNNVGVITDLGTMYRLNKQPEKAVETYQRAISIDPKFENARFNKGVVLLHDLNNPEAGIKEWEDLLLQNPMALAPNGESLDAIIHRMKNKK